MVVSRSSNIPPQEKTPALTGLLESMTPAGMDLMSASNPEAQRDMLELGSAAITSATEYATAAQGAKADTALQSAPVTSVASKTGAVTLAAGDVSGFSTVATSGSYNDLSSKPTIPAAQIQSDWTQATSSSIDFIKNKPSLGTASSQNTGFFATAAQGVKADTALQGNQTITFTGDASGSGSTNVTLTLANSGVTAGSYQSVTTDVKGRVTAGQNPSFTNNASRSLVTVAAAANGVQISSTRVVLVSYSVTITATVQIGVVTNVSGYVVLEIAATNSATAGDWQEIARIGNGQNVGLALALSLTQAVTLTLNGIVPTGYYSRLRSVNTNGTPTYTYVSGQEVLI